MKENSIINIRNKRAVIESYYNQTFKEMNTQYSSKNSFLIYFISEGKCNFSVMNAGNTKAETIKLQKNDYIMFDANANYKMQTVSEECKVFSVEFKGFDLTDKCINLGDIIQKCDGLQKAFMLKKYISLTDYGHVKNNVLRIHSLLNTNRHKYVDHLFTQVLISEMLLNINEAYSSLFLNNPYVNRAIEFIIHNYADKISIHDISNHVSLNPSYLQKIFKLETGTTIYDYLNQFRVEKSLSLIKNTKMSFIDIAMEVGFNNRQSYFNSFKNIMGISPKLFKKYLSKPLINFNKDDLVNPKPEY